MRTILEALSMWRPPAGAKVRSVAVESDDAGACAVTIRLARGDGSVAAAARAYSYAESMTLPAASIVYGLTDAAEAAWHAPRAGAERQRTSSAAKHRPEPTPAA